MNIKDKADYAIFQQSPSAYKAVADPGLPREEVHQPRGAPTYYLAIFSRKLHENEETLGGGASLAPPRSANLKLITCRESIRAVDLNKIMKDQTIMFDIGW